MARAHVPGFIEYSFRPSNVSLRNLYNRAAVFVFPSIVEGMPLTPLEAMACGCAVATTRNGGVQEYLPEGYEAVAPIRDAEGLAAAVVSLVSDNSLRIQIAERTRKIAEGLTYENMYHQFQEIMRDYE